jgi:hypothetical protein
MRNCSILVLGLLIFGVQTSISFADSENEAYQAGVDAYKQGQWDQSISQMQTVIQLNPNNWQAYQVMGYDYSEEGNSRQALAAYDESLAINPNNPTVQGLADKLRSTANGNAVPPPPAVETVADSVLKNSFYFDLGGVTPISPNGFQNSWTTGGSAGFGFGFELSRLVSIVLDASYSTFPIKATQTGFPGITYSGGGIHLATLLGNIKFKFIAEDNPVIPYIIFGLGPSQFTSDALTATNGINTATSNATAMSETDFALRFGLGIDIKLSKGTYLSIETNGMDGFTSDKVSSQGYMTYNMGRLGMKLDL